MKRNITIFRLSLLLIASASLANADTQTATFKCLAEEIMKDTAHNYVEKRVLSNGMTVLVRPVHVVPKVSMQIWYNVGSKDEKSGERGIAHLIEHMIFKGTKKLSESDINVLTHKLSGSTNAFTSYDYTGYLFNMPVQHWKECLPVLADCMQNVSFKDDHLNSEMKAVIQELKMYRDNYRRTLIFELLGDLFPDHPYHYPVIGYKQDLWSVHAANLRKFYQKHYWPNNATLVIVGDVDTQDVFDLAEKTFGKIPSNPEYKKEEFYYNNDILSRGVTIYRDIQQPFVVMSYLIPGSRAKIDHLMDVVNLILASGKASRLYRKLVDEMQLVTSISAFPFTLFEHGMYLIMFEPKDINDSQKIMDIIQKEIDSIVEKGLSEKELTRAVKQAQMSYYRLLEDIQSQAYEIGRHYLATGDPNYAFKYLTEANLEVEHEIQRLFAQYFRPAVAHKGTVLPIPDREKDLWKELQKESDQLDAKILFARERTSPIEPASYAQKIHPKEAAIFDFPKAQSLTLKNGMKVLYYHTKNTPKIDVGIRLEAQSYYEPEDKPGVYSFMTNLLTEGTQKYTAAQLAEEIENRGMSISVSPGSGHISMLSADLETGLSLMEEVLSRPRFEQAEIEKVREQMLAGLKNFWDEPASFGQQLINEQIYACHPYSKRTMGTESSVKAIKRDDLVGIHKKFITPKRATMAIVGDLEGYDLQSVLERSIGRWSGPDIEPIQFPPLKPVTPTQVTYPINRDQVVLAFAGLSVKRTDPDYDKLLLFDQIFGGGSLGSLHSYLFQLREQSGLFYGISGSLTSGSAEEKGLVAVKTKVSMDRLEEAEKVIKNTIDTSATLVTDEEFAEARHAIVNSIIGFFASNSSMASVFLFLDRYHFPADYFDKRNATLSKISKQDMIDAVKKVLTTARMIELKIGRMEPSKAVVCQTDKKKK